MSKIRCILSLLVTKNYIVITDKINDGYVMPDAASAMSLQIGEVYNYVEDLADGYELAVRKSLPKEVSK